MSFLADMTPDKILNKRLMDNFGEADLDPEVKYLTKIQRSKAMEFYFVFDRSWSMDGESITIAKEALKLFIKNLPENSKFDVVSFGSSYERMYGSAVDSNDSNRQSTIRKIENFDANFGGTELLPPLQDLVNNMNFNDHTKQFIFVITDGAVSYPDACIDLIEKYNKRITAFAFGIGEGASRELINGIARAGNGKHYYTGDRTENLLKMVQDSIGLSFEPALTLDTNKGFCVKG